MKRKQLEPKTDSDLRAERDSVAETAHLLRSPRNRARLLAAVKRARAARRSRNNATQK